MHLEQDCLYHIDCCFQTTTHKSNQDNSFSESVCGNLSQKCHDRQMHLGPNLAWRTGSLLGWGESSFAGHYCTGSQGGCWAPVWFSSTDHHGCCKSIKLMEPSVAVVHLLCASPDTSLFQCIILPKAEVGGFSNPKIAVCSASLWPAIPWIWNAEELWKIVISWVHFCQHGE